MRWAGLLEMLRAPAGRIAALVIAAAWLAVFVGIQGSSTLDISYLAYVLAPSLDMVWFSDFLSGMTKAGPFRPLDGPSPAGCVFGLGWLALIFAPGIVLIVRWLS